MVTVLAFIVVWVFLSINNVMQQIKKKIEVVNNDLQVVVNYVEPMKVSKPRSISERIKTEIKIEFAFGFNDKREQIVMLLQKLSNYEDPGEFLESNEHIHSFIFSE